MTEGARSALASIVLLAGCPAETGPAEDDVPTWHQDVAPLLAERCVGCHTAGNAAPFALDTLSSARVMASWLADIVRSGNMPPWGAAPTSECSPPHAFRRDPRLDDAQIDMLREWAAADSPEGDPETAAPIPDPVDRSLVDADERLTPEIGFSIGDETEAWRCFVVAPADPAATFIESLQIVPDRLDLLHHAYVYVIPEARVAEFEARAGAEGSFDCFGSMGWDGLMPIFDWLPDTPPLTLPPDSAIPLDPGSRLLLQMHYHGWRDGGADRTSLDVRYAPAPAYEVGFLVGGNELPGSELLTGPFQIPANQFDHDESFTYTVPPGGGGAVFSLGGRMHYAGAELSILNASQSGTCLLHIPEWDVKWMRLYEYEAPPDLLPALGDGDRLDLRCRYTNARDNDPLSDYLNSQDMTETVSMELGPHPLDEECIAVVGVLR